LVGGVVCMQVARRVEALRLREDLGLERRELWFGTARAGRIGTLLPEPDVSSAASIERFGVAPGIGRLAAVGVSPAETRLESHQQGGKTPLDPPWCSERETGRWLMLVSKLPVPLPFRTPLQRNLGRGQDIRRSELLGSGCEPPP